MSYCSAISSNSGTSRSFSCEMSYIKMKNDFLQKSGLKSEIVIEN
jgi:hypothetical protein